MPRPAKRKQTVIVTVAMELELARKLSALAREYGVSRSELIERLIIEALGPRALEQAKPQTPSDPPSPSESPDPLLQVEVEEFESKLSWLEGRTAKLEEVVKVVGGKGYFVRTGFEPSRQDLVGQVRSLIGEWHKQKGWFYRLRRDLPRDKIAVYSQRLAQLKKRLNALLALLGYERGR
jgi:hypothetical protein